MRREVGAAQLCVSASDVGPIIRRDDPAAEEPMDSVVAPVDYGPEELALRAYCAEGEQRAFALGNRGPVRFTSEGKVHPDILDAYWRCGFYVFENVLRPEEL